MKKSTKEAANARPNKAEEIKFQFDFLQQCRHDLRSESSKQCPLCKLSNMVTRDFFVREQQQRVRNREESLRQRAITRMELMLNWSRQQSLYFYEFEQNRCVQLYFCKSFLESILNLEETIEQYNEILAQHRKKSIHYEGGLFRLNPQYLDFKERQIIQWTDLNHFQHLLQRRHRIKVLGHIAALYLQSRIRRYLTQRRVRRMLLLRFEYIPATIRKPAFYVDNLKRHKKIRYPSLLGDEPPGTPRTINRRLTFEKNIQENRIQSAAKSYTNSYTTFSINDDEELGINALYQAEDGLVHFLKQLTIFRDLVHTNFAYYSTLYNQSNIYQANGNNNFAGVWLSFTAPGMSSRQLGMTIALSITTSPALNEETIHNTSSSNKNNILNNLQNQSKMNSKSDKYKKFYSKNISRSTTPTKTPTTANTTTPTPAAKPKMNEIDTSAAIYQNNLINLNRNLQVLEQAAFDALKCNSVDEVINKILTLDIFAVYQSVINISQDENDIWNKNTLSITNANENATIESTATSNTPTATARTNIRTASNTTPVTSKREENVPEVLPFGITLRPILNYYNTSNSTNSNTNAVNNNLLANTNVNGMFKLFFYEEELIAISSYSPHTYYPEVMKSKDTILHAIRKFINATNMKYFIKEYYKQANAYNTNASNMGNGNLLVKRRAPSVIKSTNTAPTVTANDTTTTTTTTNNNTIESNETPMAVQKGNVFIPSANMVFWNEQLQAQAKVPLTLQQIPDSDILLIRDNYKFASKLTIFQDRQRKAAANINKRNQRNQASQARRVIPSTANFENNNSTVNITDSTQEENATAGDHTNSEIDTNSVTTTDSNHANKSTLANTVKKRMNQINAFAVNSSNSNNTTTTANAKSRANTNKKLTTELSFANLFHTLSEKNQLVGKEVFDLLQPLHGNQQLMTTILKYNNTNGTTTDDSNNTSTPTSNGYVELLQRYCMNVDTNIKPRVARLPSLPVKFGTGQLLVLEVYVNIPKASKPPQATTTAAASSLHDDSASTTSNTNSSTSHSVHNINSNNNTNTTMPAFAVELHQVCGLFSCTGDKAPPNVDFGILSYDYFHHIYLERTQETNNTTNTNTSSNFANNSDSIRDRGWTMPNSTTGVCIGKSTLPTGREFQFHLLGSTPSRDHLLKSLPKKIRMWLGVAQEE